MIVPIFITDYWLSVVILADGNFFHRFQYEPDPLREKITKKKLQKILNKNFKRKFDGNELVVTGNLSYNTNINFDYQVNDVISRLPFTACVIDHLEVNDFSGLESEKIDDYQNMKFYGVEIPFELRLQLDKSLLRQFITAHTKDLIGKKELCFITHKLDKSNRKKYMREIIREFADTIKIAGVWEFLLDDQLAVIPVSAGLLKKGQDLSKFFAQNPLDVTGKLIIAPGVEKIKFNGKEKDLQPSQMNQIDLAMDEEAEIQWKSSKSKFKGKVFGTEFGLFIDNRDKNA